VIPGGAIREYTYEGGQSGGTIRAVDRSHIRIAEDGTEYAVLTSGRDTD